MADLVRELSALQFGKNFAESMATIGKTLGQAKRQQAADELVTEMFKGLKTDANPASMFTGENTSIFGQLMQTEEGKNRVAAMKGINDIISQVIEQRVRPIIHLPEGTKATNVVTGQEWEGAPKEETTKDIWVRATPEEAKALGMQIDREKPLVGPDGRKQVAREQLMILKSKGVKSGKITTSAENGRPISKYVSAPGGTTPGLSHSAGGGGGNPYFIKTQKYNPLGGTLVEDKISNKDPQRVIDAAQDRVRQIEQVAMNYQPSQGTWDNLMVMLHIRDPRELFPAVKAMAEDKSGKYTNNIQDLQEIAPQIYGWVIEYLGLQQGIETVTRQMNGAGTAGAGSPSGGGSKEPPTGKRKLY